MLPPTSGAAALLSLPGHQSIRAAPPPGRAPLWSVAVAWLSRLQLLMTTFLFKFIHTVAQGLYRRRSPPSPPQAAAMGRGCGSVTRRPGPAVVEADRGDMEQWALLSGKAATVLEFYLPWCCLCSSLQVFVRELDYAADGCAPAMGDFTRF